MSKLRYPITRPRTSTQIITPHSWASQPRAEQGRGDTERFKCWPCVLQANFRWRGSLCDGLAVVRRQHPDPRPRLRRLHLRPLHIRRSRVDLEISLRRLGPRILRRPRRRGEGEPEERPLQGPREGRGSLDWSRRTLVPTAGHVRGHLTDISNDRKIFTMAQKYIWKIFEILRK